MPNSTTKPAKPYPGFPLFPHATRRWAKKIRGRLVYFGPWDDPDAALQKYLDQRDDLHAGRTPRDRTDGLTVRDLVNQFLTFKRQQVEANEIKPRTFSDYHDACGRVVKAFGRARAVADLGADDFQRLNAIFAKTLGPASRRLRIQQVRSLFKYGEDSGLITQRVLFGPGFKLPPKRLLRKARQANGPKMFEADEIKTLLEASSGPLRAMILLGINCGFGNYDCATLPLRALDLDGGWVEHPRPKTGAERRCRLWPETVAALRKAIAQRPKEKEEKWSRLVFLTELGNAWATDTPNAWRDSVTEAFRILSKVAGLWKHGRGFYALRHTFETIGGESIDQVAVDHIMGHQRGDMASVYRERISDERLQNVTNHVREWLFPPEENK